MTVKEKTFKKKPGGDAGAHSFQSSLLFVRFGNAMQILPQSHYCT